MRTLLPFWPGRTARGAHHGVLKRRHTWTLGPAAAMFVPRLTNQPGDVACSADAVKHTREAQTGPHSPAGVCLVMPMRLPGRRGPRRAPPAPRGPLNRLLFRAPAPEAQGLLEFAAGADVQLREHLAQVPLHGA